MHLPKNQGKQLFFPFLCSSQKQLVMLRYLIRILGGLLVVVLLYSLFVMYYTYSEGNRAGKLIKFSNKGYVFKTHEGDLNLGGITTTNGGLMNQLWQFSVVDEEVARQLSSMEGKEITLHYKEKLRTLPWRGDSKYIVDSIVSVR
jgi:hypothetical protein